MDIAKFSNNPVLGILRGAKLDIIEPLVDACAEAGLGALEITMNTDGAADQIRVACKASKGRLAIGAGTVLDLPSLKAALKAGATFIVTPVLIPDVTQYCVKNRIPIFPGALTPKEVFEAWQAGAAMVKVFPAGVFGPSYFRELKGPFNGIELLACGGVTPENKKDYFSSGASAVAFGAGVFRKEWLENKDLVSIKNRVREFIR